MQLSKKQKKISPYFALSLKFTSNFEHFEKDDPHSLCISQITDCETLG